MCQHFLRLLRSISPYLLLYCGLVSQGEKTSVATDLGMRFLCNVDLCRDCLWYMDFQHHCRYFKRVAKNRTQFKICWVAVLSSCGADFCTRSCHSVVGITKDKTICWQWMKNEASEIKRKETKSLLWACGVYEIFRDTRKRGGINVHFHS